MESLAHEAWRFAASWLARPALSAPLLVLVGVLFGMGKGLGLPRLFWSRLPGEQFQAGAATTLVFFEAVLANALLQEPRSAADLGRFALTASAIAAVVLALAAILAGRKRERSRGRFTPAIRRLDARTMRQGPREEAKVSPVAFVGGALVATTFVAVLTLVAFFVPGNVRDPILRALHVAGTTVPEFHFLALLGAVVFVTAFLFPRRVVPAAVAICALSGLVIGVHGFISFKLWPPGLELVVLASLLSLSGLVPFRIRFKELNGRYANPAQYPPESLGTSGQLAVQTALSALQKQKARKLVLVCASGGGIRAATWTAAILGRLERLRGFLAANRWISGASGGMVGASIWRAAEGRLDWEALAKAVAMDSLTPTVRQLVFKDVPFAFLPFRNRADRGSALQEAWITNLANVFDLRIPIARLRESEENGTWPSLVFSPMLVEDGRRLLLSNLDLGPATDHQAHWLSSRELPTHPSTGLAARTGYALADLCPGALEEVTLATAARMSASFPFVSPAAALPTKPVRRVVDAGYYDNYGVELACSWLRALLEGHRDPLTSSVDAILVIQIRDNVSELSVNPSTPEELTRLRDRAAEDNRWLVGFQGLSSPLEAVLSARESSMLFRNDAQLEAVKQLLFRASRNPDYLTTTVFEFAGEASLSWRLDEDERGLLIEQARSPGIGEKLEAVGKWLSS